MFFPSKFEKKHVKRTSEKNLLGVRFFPPKISYGSLKVFKFVEFFFTNELYAGEGTKEGPFKQALYTPTTQNFQKIFELILLLSSDIIEWALSVT